MCHLRVFYHKIHATHRVGESGKNYVKAPVRPLVPVAYIAIIDYKCTGKHTLAAFSISSSELGFINM